MSCWVSADPRVRMSADRAVPPEFGSERVEMRVVFNGWWIDKDVLVRIRRLPPTQSQLQQFHHLGPYPPDLGQVREMRSSVP
jgi:hypothetical protein